MEKQKNLSKKKVKERIREIKKADEAEQTKTSTGLVFSLMAEIESYLNLHKFIGYLKIPNKRFLKKRLKYLDKRTVKNSAIRDEADFLKNRSCSAQLAVFQESIHNYTLQNFPVLENHALPISHAVSEYERKSEKSVIITPVLDSWFHSAEENAGRCIQNIAETITDSYRSDFLKFRDPSLDQDFCGRICAETEQLYKKSLSNLNKTGISFPGIIHKKQEQPKWKDTETFLQIRKIFEKCFPSLDPKIFSAFDPARASLRPGKLKRGGAFTDPVNPEAGPRLFMNFRSHMQDVLTLAHESGHMFYYMLRRNKNYFSYAASDLHSEISAAFAEFLILDNLDIDKKEKQEQFRKIIHYKIIRQNIIFRAEYEYYKSVQNNKNSSPSFADFWGQSWNSYIKGSGDEHKSWFAYNRHYIFYPLYGITYSAGTLAGLGFFHMLEKGLMAKEAFIEFLKKDFQSCSKNEEFMDAVMTGFELVADYF